MSNTLLVPRVGVGVLIKRSDKFLLGKRKGAHGSGSWAPPGGHLDFGEDVIDCAKREVLEETGLSVLNPRFITFTNDIFTKENKHYITLWMLCESLSGTPQLLEPDKCEKWEWFNLKSLPSPLFITVQNLLKQDINLLQL